MVLKLDMAKAYDKLEWKFLIKVLEKIGFDSYVVDQIWSLVANNWYSVLINGQARGFFHSSRGLKQRDPLYPALFILDAEVLSTALDSLFHNPG